MARAPAQVGLNGEEQTMMNQRSLIKLGAVTVVAVIAAFAINHSRKPVSDFSAHASSLVEGLGEHVNDVSGLSLSEAGAHKTVELTRSRQGLDGQGQGRLSGRYRQVARLPAQGRRRQPDRTEDREQGALCRYRGQRHQRAGRQGHPGRDQRAGRAGQLHRRQLQRAGRRNLCAPQPARHKAGWPRAT